MKKEVLFAILAGISIGLIFAFSAWKASLIYKNKNLNILNRVQSTPNIKANYSLVIDQPVNHSVNSARIINAKGVGLPNSHIIISSNQRDYFAKTLEDGTFDIKINLDQTLNNIRISNFTQSTVLEQKDLKIVYWSKEVKNNDVYIGLITDIADDTVQIRSLNSEILQASFDQNTKYYDGLRKNQEIKSSDLAIGDYLITIGRINGNKVLNAETVIVAEDIKNNYNLILGNIKSIAKTTILLETEDGKEMEFNLPKTWNGPDVKDMEIGQVIAVSWINQDGKDTLRTIISLVE